MNSQNLEAIAKSMFILCLDISPVPGIGSVDETDLTEENGEEFVSKYCQSAQTRNDELLAVQMLHGQGSKYNGANRWYDKTMQVGTQPHLTFYQIIIRILIHSCEA